MRRVCRPGARIIFLNQFRSQNPLVASFEQEFFLFLGRHIGLPVCLEGA